MTSQKESLQPEPTADSAIPRMTIVEWSALAAILLATAAIRIRLLDVPLDRDEGHYAYVAQALLDGLLPYEHAHTYFFPGIYLAFAAIFATLGESIRSIHSTLLAMNLATLVVCYGLARRLFGPTTAIGTAAALALASLGRNANGFTANSEHFVLLAALTGLLGLVLAIETRRLWQLAVGASLLGISITMKQHGVFFAAFGGLVILVDTWTRSDDSWAVRLRWIGVYAAGVAAPLIAMVLLLWQANILRSFWFWAIEFGVSYATRLSLRDGLSEFVSMGSWVFAPLAWLAPFALVGLAAQVSPRLRSRHSALAFVFLVISFVAVCPGLYFRPHYWLLLFPALALWVGIGLDCVARVLEGRLQVRALSHGAAALTLLLAIALSVHGQYRYYFVDTPERVSLKRYGVNPFVEALEIGHFIERTTSPDDTVAVLGSEPEILFYAKRRSATGYLATDLLTRSGELAERMQANMIHEIESSSPEILVVVAVGPSWNLSKQSSPLLRDWLRRNLDHRYERVAVVELNRPRRSRLLYGDSLPEPAQGSDWIVVARARGD